MNYTCHSGGAIGSDSEFEKISIKYGVKVNAYSFEEHTTNSKNQIILTDDEIAIGWEKAQKAAKSLKRNTHNLSPYVKKLLARDWFQVKNSSAIFAVGYILDPGEQGTRIPNKTNSQVVDGGTGYCCMMAIQHKKLVYVFNQKDNRWYKWEYNQFREIDYIPKLTENFAGVGTRELSYDGENAIEELYSSNFR